MGWFQQVSLVIKYSRMITKWFLTGPLIPCVWYYLFIASNLPVMGNLATTAEGWNYTVGLVGLWRLRWILYICSFMGEHRQTINYDKLIFLGPLCSGPLVSIFGGNKNRIIPQRSKVIALSNGPLALSSLYSPKMSRNVLLAFGKSQSGIMFNQSHYHHHKHVLHYSRQRYWQVFLNMDVGNVVCCPHLCLRVWPNHHRQWRRKICRTREATIEHQDVCVCVSSVLC